MRPIKQSLCQMQREVFLPGQDAPVAVSDMSLHARLKPEEPAHNKISEGHKPGASYTTPSLPLPHPVPRKHGWQGQASPGWGGQSPPSPNPPMCCIPSLRSAGWSSFLGKFEKPPSSHCHLQTAHCATCLRLGGSLQSNSSMQDCCASLLRGPLEQRSCGGSGSERA